MNLNEKGLTLLEVLITTTILLVILTVIYSLIGGIVNSWKKGSSKIDLQQNARIAVQMLERDIKNAKPYSEVTGIFIKSDGTEIRFKLDNVNGTQDEVRYYRRGNLLLRKLNNAAANQVAYNVKNINFNFYTAPQSPVKNRSLVLLDLEVGNAQLFYKISSNIYVRSANY